MYKGIVEHVSLRGAAERRRSNPLKFCLPGKDCFVLPSGLLAMTAFLLFASPTHAQHLRIYACAIANDSAGAALGGSSNGSGLYQSDDTGKTWTHLGWDNIKCYSMDMVQSSNGRILYEATGLGVLRSTDYGEHWKQVTDWRISEAMDVAVNQKNPNEIYIATAHGPWRTRDGGKQWKGLMKGLACPFCSKIVIDSVIPNHVHLATECGLFALRNSEWKLIPCYGPFHPSDDPNSNHPTHVEQIRSLEQVDTDSWRASSAKAFALHSEDSGKSFYVIDSVSPLWFWSNNVFGGPEGATLYGKWRANTTHTMIHPDNIMDVSDGLVVKYSFPLLNGDQIPYNGLQYYNIAILGTVRNGIIVLTDSRDSLARTTSLPHRQIWTLKSFLVTP